MPKYSAIPTSAIFAYYKGLVIKQFKKRFIKQKQEKEEEQIFKEIPKPIHLWVGSSDRGPFFLDCLDN
jgi:hypothetical protein